jgi:hypothetical protein
MSISSLPSLNLSLHKHKSVSSSSTNTLDNKNVNTTNIYLVPNDKTVEMLPISPKPLSRPISVAPKEDLQLADEVPPQPSPKDRISMDFMKTLIRIQNEILLNNILLINNLKELGDRIIYRDIDLKEMIEILMSLENKNVIDIRTEEKKKTSCGCMAPIYVKIKSIMINKTIPFLHTEIATRMSDEFKISLEYCVPTEE